MSVNGTTHKVQCDQCHLEGPTAESLVEDTQGWKLAWKEYVNGRKLVDLCPKCQADWEILE